VIGAKAIVGVILAVAVAGQALVIPWVAQETVAVYPEVALVCLWRLLSLAGRSKVFQPGSFRLVDAIIGCCLALLALCAGAAVVLNLNHALNPGVGIALMAAGIAAAGLSLLLAVMRGLLKQATQLEADWAEVV
jgi:hypothetical protein